MKKRITEMLLSSDSEIRLLALSYLDQNKIHSRDYRIVVFNNILPITHAISAITECIFIPGMIDPKKMGS